VTKYTQKPVNPEGKLWWAFVR